MSRRPVDHRNVFKRLGGVVYSFMLKNLEGQQLEIFQAAQQKAADQGRTMKWVILSLLHGWVKGIYMLGAK